MKQYLIIFLVCFIGLFFLASGIFGFNGYLHNRELKRQIYEAEYHKDKLNVEISSLKEQKAHLASEDGLRDLANDLGYYVQGDTVYLFNEPSIQDTVDSNQYNTDDIGYKPLSNASVLLLDLCVSLVVSFVIWILSRDRHVMNVDKDGDDSGDPDIYINA